MTHFDAPLQKQKNMDHPIKRAQLILFAHGVQMRMAVALILSIFALILPLVTFLYFPFGIYLAIAFELFITLPLGYGLFYMARRAADQSEISIHDLFVAFSWRYGHALWTMLWFVVLLLLPFLIPVGIVFGVTCLSNFLESTQTLFAFSVPILMLGYTVAGSTLFPIFLLQIPSYLLVALRMKYPTYSCVRCVKKSARLLRGEFAMYLRIRMRELLLFLASCATVCALFPIYTLPLSICIMTGTVDLLEERKAKKYQKLNAGLN